MQDEIKEIIEALENTIKDDRIPYEIESFECKKILDYITNLQEENERLQKLLDFEIERNDLKQDKIDKAIEYGKELRLFDNESLEFEIGTNFINILKGENNES